VELPQEIDALNMKKRVKLFFGKIKELSENKVIFE